MRCCAVPHSSDPGIACARVRQVHPLVGYDPAAAAAAAAATGEEGGEGGEGGGEEGGGGGVEAWEGLDALSSSVLDAVGGLVGGLESPEGLKEALVDYGVLCASRGLPAGAPFEAFGSALLGGLGEALGEAMPEGGGAAWKDAYAEAAACMQTAFTPSQLKAAAEAAAAKADAEAEEPAES